MNRTNNHIHMGKRKRDQLQRPICDGRAWMRDIIESAFMTKVLKDDLVEELAYMHSIRSIKRLIPHLFEKIISMRNLRYYPTRIIVYLDNIYKGIIIHFIDHVRNRIRNGPNPISYNDYYWLHSIIRLSMLETSLWGDIKCHNNIDVIPLAHLRNNHRHKSCRQYIDILNDVAGSCILDYWKHFNDAPEEDREHFISAFISSSVHHLSKHIWYKYIDAFIKNGDGEDLILKTLIDSTTLCKL